MVERKILLKIPAVAGIDMSITSEVVLVWLAGLVTFLFLMPACRRKGKVASGIMQNLGEVLFEFAGKHIAGAVFSPAARVKWGAFITALFLFIFFANLLGMVPYPAFFKAATSSLSVTLAMSLMVFVLSIAAGVRVFGPAGFARKFLPHGVPWWIAPFVALIEIISWLLRPFSLAVRLFANMFVGHALVFTFIGMEVATAWFLKPFPLAGAVAMSGFEIFVCFIQAFIFAMLACIYIRESIEAEPEPQ